MFFSLIIVYLAFLKLLGSFRDRFSPRLSAFRFVSPRNQLFWTAFLSSFLFSLCAPIPASQRGLREHDTESIPVERPFRAAATGPCRPDSETQTRGREVSLSHCSCVVPSRLPGFFLCMSRPNCCGHLLATFFRSGILFFAATLDFLFLR